MCYTVSMTRERWVSHAREHKLGERALRLQAKEYERRLETLNHENARILSAQDTYLRKDNYESGKKELEQRIDTLVREFSQRFESQANLSATNRDATNARITNLEQGAKELAALTAERKNATDIAIAERTRRATINMWLIGTIVAIVSLAASLAIHFIHVP